jgi:hypothetical protein
VLVPGEARTAPPVFNAARYAERANPPSSSSHLQYSSHIHSQSLAGLGLVGAGRLGYGLGGPPSPTGKKGQQEVTMLGGMKLPEKKRTASGSKKEEDTKSPLQPTHHSSLSTSSAFFSSIRRRSNPLQPANKVPNSAKTVQPSIPATTRGGSTPPSNLLASEDRSNIRDKSTSTLHFASMAQIQSPQAQISSMTQIQIQAQAQAQRQRRSHRRNVSAGAMITSVIDEVSSDGTVSNKLSATRDRALQKSGLRESTTASEIRRDPLDGEPKDANLNGLGTEEPTRLSTSSERSTDSMSRVVSPIEFSRISEESNASFSFKAPAFRFPRSMNIRSPLLSSEDGHMDKMSGEPRPVGGTSNGLLPPIELCPPSPPEVPDTRSSVTALAQDPKAKLVKEISSSSSSSLTDPDADATPLAVPRRRHHVQMSNGTVIPARALDPPRQQKLEDTPTGLSASVSAPMSMVSAGSSTTLLPNGSGVNKHHEIITGRTSPGISASLGRLTGSSTAERIEERSGTKGNGVARRNSLTGGTTSATLSTSGSMGGGLKIPARISMKQDALKRDLNAVREFAGSINGTLHSFMIYISS